MKKKTAPKNQARTRFDGEGALKDLPNDSYFRILKKDGTMSRKTYIKRKGSYDRSIRKYCVVDCDDVWGYGKELKGSTRVTTKFTY